MKSIIKFITMLTGLSENLLTVVTIARLVLPVLVIGMALFVFLIIAIVFKCCS